MDIAILGGGVAGISSAIALKQKGFDVSVYERHDAPANIGAGIVIWPNAAYVLSRFGLLEEVANVSGYPQRMCRWSSSGEDLGAIDINMINALMGYPSLSILRRDLQSIMLAKLESLGGSVNYSHTVTGIKTSPSGRAEVSFHNGRVIDAHGLPGAGICPRGQYPHLSGIHQLDRRL